MKFLLSFFLFLGFLFPLSYQVYGKLISKIIDPLNQSLSLGVKVRPFTKNDFEGKSIYTHHNIASYQMDYLPDSLEWVRVNGVLLPRGQFKIILRPKLPYKNGNLTLRYQNQKYPLKWENKNLVAKVTISLLHHNEMIIDSEKTNFFAKLGISPSLEMAKNIPVIHEYQCSKYLVKVIEQKTKKLLSLNCQLFRVGEIGNERPILKIKWLLAGAKDSEKINEIIMTKSGLYHLYGQEIIVKVELKERMKRFKTALGFGPYYMKSSHYQRGSPHKLAAAGMIYSNFYLIPSVSVRAFEAFFIRDSTFFNNFGLYFAYEAANAFDGRLQIIPLLGIQGLSFHYKGDAKTFSEITLPQGLELVYKHPFGLEGYLFVYGMFLSPSSKEDYKNLWIRFGQKVFFELNYIDWEKGGRKANMYGLSLGIPFLSLF